MEGMVAVIVGGMEVAVGEKVIVLGASVEDGLIVGVIKCCGNASSVSAAAVFTLAIAISIIFGGCKTADVFGFASAIPAVTQSRLKPSMPAPTTHRRST